jgi:hypothetical protein
MIEGGPSREEDRWSLEPFRESRLRCGRSHSGELKKRNEVRNTFSIYKGEESARMAVSFRYLPFNGPDL